MALNMENVFETYYRIDQVARMLNTSRFTIYALIKDGRFPSARKAAPDGCPGNPGWEINAKDVIRVRAEREEAKQLPKTKQKKRSAKNTDAEMIELLKELHATMVKQTEIIGKLIEKMT